VDENNEGMGASKNKLPSYLFVVPSTCQMYSGTGKVIFDWIIYAKDYFDFEFIMDDENLENFLITERFCERNQIPMHRSQTYSFMGCIDPGVALTYEVIKSKKWDFIECVSWANAATNLQILSCIAQDTHLIYTPHTQPVWTIPDHEHHFLTEIAFKKTLNRANHIFVDSEYEGKILKELVKESGKIVMAHIGVSLHNEGINHSEDKTKPQVLSIFDFREQRKRLDLLFKTIENTSIISPDIKFNFVGKNSDKAVMPKSIQNSVQTHGYVNDEELYRLYKDSRVFLILPDYEAFCIPIAEALVHGCEVVTSNIEPLKSIYGNLLGVHFIDSHNEAEVANQIIKVFQSRDQSAEISRAAKEKFSFDRTYGVKLRELLSI
jgi:glycosyltransferase involved in cell wall biosynthesis